MEDKAGNTALCAYVAPQQNDIEALKAALKDTLPTTWCRRSGWRWTSFRSPQTERLTKKPCRNRTLKREAPRIKRRKRNGDAAF
nr:hypothetical protein [Bacillus amyloliquefaciens]